MRIAGIVRNTAAETCWWQHQDILAECEARRAGWEGHFGPPPTACPWGCDGSGWRLVEDDEDQEPKPLEIVADGVIYTPCECNVSQAGQVRRYFADYVQKKAA